MEINYKRLFNLVIGHNYFVDGYDRFVSLFPLTETEALLRNGKMLFKKMQYGISVLYRTGSDGISPFSALSGNQSFRFYLSASNAATLMNITDLSESAARKFGSKNLLFFTNDPANASNNKNNPEVLNYSIIDSLQPQLFTYSFSVSGNPAKVLLRVSDEKGNLVPVGEYSDGTPFPVTLTLEISSTNTFSQQIDLRKKSKGRYTISILNIAGTTTLKEEKIYADDLLSGKNITGIVDLKYNDATALLYGPAEEYKIQFTRNVSMWKYIIINKSGKIDFESDSLLINDSGIINGGPYQTNHFPRAYAGILLEADSPGEAGNLTGLQYSGTGLYPALTLSGDTLAEGTASANAKGFITIINNSVSGYTLTIDGVDLTEGADFAKGATPEDTANAIINAIENNAAVHVTASLLSYDIKVNGMQSLVFRSEENIPFFELPKTSIQLRKASNNQTIDPNLPNPSVSTIRKTETGVPEAEVYVFI